MGSDAARCRARRCGRAAPGWRGLLELRAKAHQQVLAAEVGHQLDATGKTVVRPSERQRQRGLAGDVERPGERAPPSGFVAAEVITEQRRGAAVVGVTSTSMPDSDHHPVIARARSCSWASQVSSSGR